VRHHEDLHPPGGPARAGDFAETGRLSRDARSAELEGVLQRSYIWVVIYPEDADALLDAIRRKAEFLPPLGAIPPYSRDRKGE